MSKNLHICAKRLLRRLRLVRGRLWIAVWLSIAGCGPTLPNVVQVSESIQCQSDPSQCVLVPKTFVYSHIDDQERIIRLQMKLEACRQHRTQ